MSDTLNNDQIIEVVKAFDSDYSVVEPTGDVYRAVADAATAQCRRAWGLHAWWGKAYILECHCSRCEHVFPYPYMWLPGASTEENQVPTECPNCELGIELEVLGLLGA